MMKKEQQPRKTTFYSELPKLELHAHLSGLIGSNTMKKETARKPGLKIHDQMTTNDKGRKRTLEECFLIFQIIHQLAASPEDILMGAKYVIKEFSEDGVKYLELRAHQKRKCYRPETLIDSVLEGINCPNKTT